MTSFFEKLVRGAASVKLAPSRGYDTKRINTYYTREAKLRGVPFDTALIARVSAERRLDMNLFYGGYFSCMVAAAVIAPWNEALACVFGLAPSALFVMAFLLKRRLPAE